jgi:hypothetical protein
MLFKKTTAIPTIKRYLRIWTSLFHVNPFNSSNTSTLINTLGQYKSVAARLFELDSLRLIVVVFFLGVGATSCGHISKLDHQVYQQKVKPTVIVNVNVLSEDGSSMLSNRNVYLDEGLISRITTGQVTESDYHQIDGSNKFLIPGLMDSHVHLKDNPNDLLVFAAYGITYVREMSGNKRNLAWREDIENGRLGPKIYVTSSKVTTPDGIYQRGKALFRNRIPLDDRDDAEKLVKQLIVDGFDAVKVSSSLSKEVYEALSEIVRNKPIDIVGHIPNTIALQDLWRSEQRELAHIEELSKSLDKEFGHYKVSNAAEYLNYVRQRSGNVAAKLKQLNFAVGSTIWYINSIPKQALELDSFITGLDLSLANPKYVSRWQPGENYFELDPSLKANSKNIEATKIYWDTYVEAMQIVLRELLKYEVTILAGTDTMNSLVAPGISLHHELEALVQAGMSPAQALQSATVAPARWMQVNTGSIKAGFQADLVLLDANPLADITHTTSINSVILSGQVINKKKVNQILSDVRKVYGSAP